MECFCDSGGIPWDPPHFGAAVFGAVDYDCWMHSTSGGSQPPTNGGISSWYAFRVVVTTLLFFVVVGNCSVIECYG